MIDAKEFPEWTYHDGNMYTRIDNRLYAVELSSDMRSYKVCTYGASATPHSFYRKDVEVIKVVPDKDKPTVECLREMWDNIKKNLPNIIMENAL